MIGAISSLAASMVKMGEKLDQVIQSIVGELMDSLARRMDLQIAMQEITKEDAEALGILPDDGPNGTLLS